MGVAGRLGVAAIAAGWIAACAGAPEPAPAHPHAETPAAEGLAAPAVTAYTGPARGHGAMPGVRPTKMAAALAAAGLDVRALPPLETLAPGPRQKVMRTFTETLGIPCVGCHADDAFREDTRRKRVARRMWNEIVRVVAMRDGSPVYCDSCHDGALFHLGRHDSRTVAAYMSKNMVGALKRVDGQPHDCTTCHGDPPDFFLVGGWKDRPAPLLTNDPGEASLTPHWPLAGERAPDDCGPAGEHSPLAARMRLVIAPYFHDGKTAAPLLAAALEEVAGFAPDDPAFVASAREAAAIARGGDQAGTLAACGACHAAHKARWRAERRTRGPR